MNPRDHSPILLPALAASSLIALFAACLIGSTPLSAESVLHALWGQGSVGERTILWEIRLPRALAAFLVGAALSLSGAALQGMLRNPLAEPGVLGVSASASLGAVFVLYYGYAEIWAPATPLAAIAMALAATALLGFVADRVSSVVTLILVGIGLSNLAAALLALLMSIAPNPFSLSDMVTWLLGSVAQRSFDDIALSLPFMIAGVAVLLATRPGLKALTLGEEAASGIGLDLKRARLGLVIGAGLTTGAAVSIAGSIAFVGIVVPHLIRPLVGHDPARALIPAALAGGVLLVLADILVRVLPTDGELKLGVVAALIGAPIFVWIAARRRALESAP